MFLLWARMAPAMSKSRGNTIEPGMSADETAEMLKKAKTDAERTITIRKNRPEVSNRSCSPSLASGQDPLVIADSIGDKGAGAFEGPRHRVS